MGRVILRRIAGAIPVVLLVTLITFGLMRLIPGDVSAALAGVSATPAEREQIRHNLGLDQPVFGFQPRWFDGHSERYSSAEEAASEEPASEA